MGRIRKIHRNFSARRASHRSTPWREKVRGIASCVPSSHTNVTFDEGRGNSTLGKSAIDSSGATDPHAPMDYLSRYAHRPVAFLYRYVRLRFVAHLAILLAVLA